MENKIFRLTSDGWFTFYVCRFCGKRIQLEIDETPLPDECPYCHAKNTTDKENDNDTK